MDRPDEIKAKQDKKPPMTQNPPMGQNTEGLTLIHFTRDDPKLESDKSSTSPAGGEKGSGAKTPSPMTSTKTSPAGGEKGSAAKTPSPVTSAKTSPAGGEKGSAAKTPSPVTSAKTSPAGGEKGIRNIKEKIRAKFLPTKKGTTDAGGGEQIPKDSLKLEKLFDEDDHGETVAYISMYEKNKQRHEELLKKCILTEAEYLELKAHKENIAKYELISVISEQLLNYCLVPTYNNICMQNPDMTVSTHEQFIQYMRTTILNLMSTNIVKLAAVHKIQWIENEPEDTRASVSRSIILRCADALYLDRSPSQKLQVSEIVGYDTIIQHIKELKINLHQIYDMKQLPQFTKISDLIRKFEEFKLWGKEELETLQKHLEMIKQLTQKSSPIFCINSIQIESLMKQTATNKPAVIELYQGINSEIGKLITDIAASITGLDPLDQAGKNESLSMTSVPGGSSLFSANLPPPTPVSGADLPLPPPVSTNPSSFFGGILTPPPVISNPSTVHDISDDPSSEKKEADLNIQTKPGRENK